MSQNLLKKQKIAYWASWADAIPMLRKRAPSQAREILEQLSSPGPSSASCLQEVRQCGQVLEEVGFATPTWEAVWGGLRPSQPDLAEPGEWGHGWQYYASAKTESHHRSNVVVPSLSTTEMALLRSQSGCCAGRHLMLLPVSTESTYSGDRFLALLLRRLRLPLPVAAARCNGNTCRAALDVYGDHRAACSRAGRLTKRGSPVERMWARVCREGGARVQTNVFLRDLNLAGVRADDGRRIEVIANGLPLYHGAQLAIDATIVSPVRGDSLPTPQAAGEDGVALRRACRVKRRRYAILTRSRRCRLLVAAVETGGRWREEPYRFLVELARAKARSAPYILRTSLTNAWIRRWTGMIAFAVHDALAASLLEEVPTETLGTDGADPTLGDLLCHV